MILDIDAPDKQCPSCGGALEEMAGQYEETEEFDVVERLWVRRKITAEPSSRTAQAATARSAARATSRSPPC